MKDNLKKLLLAIFLFIIIVSLIFFLRTSFEELSPSNNVYNKTVTRPLLNLEENNGIFTNIWFRDESQLDRFVKNDMKYLFVDVGHIEKNGRLITSEEELRGFIDFIEDYEDRENFDFVLIPYNEIILDDYDFSSEEFRENIIKNHVNLIELGFDGALIDIEAIPFNLRSEYLNFLEDIGEEIGADNLLVAYAGALDKTPNKWEWEPDFFGAVSDRVDIISTQSYDFHLNNKKDYQEYLTNQLEELSNNEWNARILFTAPTHKPYPETLENALEVYSENIERNKANQFFGVVVFAEWTTDNYEWKIFESY